MYFCNQSLLRRQRAILQRYFCSSDIENICSFRNAALMKSQNEENDIFLWLLVIFDVILVKAAGVCLRTLVNMIINTANHYKLDIYDYNPRMM